MRKRIEQLKHGRNNNLNDIYESQVIGLDGIRLDEKMKYSGKYLQEQIDKIIEGKISVGLARGLFSDTKINQTNQQFIIRTTGGSSSVSSGEAELVSYQGTCVVPSKIQDVINTRQLVEVVPLIVEIVDKDDFRQATGSSIDEFTFYKLANGKFSCEEIPDSEIELGETKIGIKLSGSSYKDGDKFSVTDDGTDVNAVVTCESRITASFNPTANYGLIRQQLFGNASVQGRSYSATLVYDNGSWKRNGTTINLNDYGILINPVAVGDQPLTGDTILLTATRGNFGTIQFSTPTQFKALGMNAHNTFDLNSMVIPNHTIDSNGNVIPSEGKFICYAKAVYNVNNEAGYTVYDENDSTSIVGWCANIPTISTTGITTQAATGKVSHVTFNSDGYIVAVCTNVTRICIHPTWSGYLDEVYTEYKEYVLDLPVKTADDTVIALECVGNTGNVVNLKNKQYSINITKTPYSPAALYNYILDNPTKVYGTDYEYDNNYIYSVQSTVTKSLADDTKYIYYCNDFSTEEFIGTSLAVKCTLAYGQNLVDKLRNDVVTQEDLEEAISETLMITINESDYIALRDSNNPATQLDLTKEYRVLRPNNTVKLMKKPYSTIRINQKGFVRQPSRMIIGDIGYLDTDLNIVTWIRNNSHMYVGKLDNNTFKIKQLSDFDRTKYADGTDASTDITTLGYDVFMKLPEFWYKSVETSEGSDLWDISFANNANHVDNTWNHYKGNKFIGVYEGYVEVDAETPTNTKLYSCSGKTPTVNTSQSAFKTYARQKGNDSRNITDDVANSGYKIVDYEMHTVMAILGYAYYGNTDIQAICGSGTSSYPKVCGGRNNLGMSDTIVNIDGNNGSINYWGIENWWGDICEFMDDLITANSSGLVNIRNYNNNNNIRQVQVDTTQFTLSTDRCISKLTFGANCDVIPKAGVVNGSYNTHFADYGYVYAGAGYVAYRSGHATIANGGLAYLRLGYGTAFAGAYIGARLLYEGAYTVVDNF